MKFQSSNKIPLDRLPVELRMIIYEFANVDRVAINEREYLKPWSRTILLAAILNDLEALHIASIQGEDVRNMICPLIALAGNLPALKWARSNKVVTLASHGNKRLRRSQLPWDRRTCKYAASGGDFETLEWAIDHNCPWNRGDCVNAALIRGRLEVLMWLQERGCHIPKTACKIAGTLEMLKWLHAEEDFKLYKECWQTAATRSNLRMLNWLRLKKCPLLKNACSSAAKVGNLPALEWLHEHGFSLNKDCWAKAARLGSLRTLKWLHENDCPFLKTTCIHACREGHLTVLKWLVKKCRSPKYSSCWIEAAENGHLPILKWLHKVQWPMVWNKSDVVRKAARGNHEHVLTWLREHNFPSA
jgi:hypothetical protein